MNILAFTCSLPSSSGVTCGPGVSYKYYYNSQTQECETFEFLGCDGNSNNFATRGECESFCGVGGIFFVIDLTNGHIHKDRALIVIAVAYNFFGLSTIVNLLTLRVC